jgi:hypothetical protein
MAGGYEIDVVTPLGLQFQHDRRQVFWFDLVASVSLADVVVLAKLALKIAPTEENGAGPTPAT